MFHYHEISNPNCTETGTYNVLNIALNLVCFVLVISQYSFDLQSNSHWMKPNDSEKSCCWQHLRVLSIGGGRCTPPPPGRQADRQTLPGQTPPGHRPLLGRHAPGRHPLGRHPLGRHPPPHISRPLQWTVRILLECILVDRILFVLLLFFRLSRCFLLYSTTFC